MSHRSLTYRNILAIERSECMWLARRNIMIVCMSILWVSVCIQMFEVALEKPSASRFQKPNDQHLSSQSSFINWCLIWGLIAIFYAGFMHTIMILLCGGELVKSEIILWCQLCGREHDKRVFCVTLWLVHLFTFNTADVVGVLLWVALGALCMYVATAYCIP